MDAKKERLKVVAADESPAVKLEVGTQPGSEWVHALCKFSEIATRLRREFPHLFEDIDETTPDKR